MTDQQAFDSPENQPSHDQSSGSGGDGNPGGGGHRSQEAPAPESNPAPSESSPPNSQGGDGGGTGGSTQSSGGGSEGEGSTQQGGDTRGEGGSRRSGGSEKQGQGQGRRRSRRGRGRRRRGRRREQEDDLAEDDENREPGVVLGILEVLSSGSGFIRRADAGYVPSKNDIYVGSRVIHKFGLRTGDELTGAVGRRPRNGKSPPLRHLDLVNGLPPDEARKRPEFNRLSAMHPREQLRLECGRTIGGEPDMTNRVIDLFCPFGKGQRAMIVAPAKAGKTTVLQAVAEGVVSNHPECELMILLVDERPEEVTEMEQCGFGEVIASTFDRQRRAAHCQVAEMTLERARRRAEARRRTW